MQRIAQRGAVAAPALPAMLSVNSPEGGGPTFPSPGLFSEEEEERERLEMAPEEIYESVADVCGTHGDPIVRGEAASGSLLPSKEELASVAKALSAMEKELDCIPTESKRSYLEALRQCPYELNANKRAAFLHREDFDAAAAAKRLVRYWEKKLELFGPERCYVPLTLERSMGDKEVVVLSNGVMSLLPDKDNSGRALIVIRNALADKNLPVEVFLRAFWYVSHCALEDPETQKRGYVYLLNSKGMTFGKINFKLISGVTELEKTYLPARMRATHHCFPPNFLRAISPIVKAIAGRRLRSRMCIHGGSDQTVLEQLSKYGITPDRLPREFGGTLDFQPSRWMIDRLELEQRRMKSLANKLDFLATAILQAERPDNTEHRISLEDREQNEHDKGGGQSAPVAKKRREFTSAFDQASASIVEVNRALPPSTLNSSIVPPQASRVQLGDIQQQLPLPSHVDDTPKTAIASSSSMLPPDIGFNESALRAVYAGGLILSDHEKALLNAAISDQAVPKATNQDQPVLDMAPLRLLQEESHALQRQVAEVSDLTSLLPLSAATAASSLGALGEPSASLPALLKGTSTGSFEAFKSLLQRADTSTLQKLLVLSKQTDSELGGIGVELHSQPRPNNIILETLMNSFRAGTGTGSHAPCPSFSLQAASQTTLSEPNLRTAPNPSSHKPSAASGIISQIGQTNNIMIQSEEQTQLASLQQSSVVNQLMQSLHQQQQQQPVASTVSLSDNVVDATPLHLPLGSNSVSDRLEPPPLQLPRTLYVNSDDAKISAYQCLVRHQIEAFAATEEHVQNHARGRCKPIALGQVGIRCRHCRGLPLKCSPLGSIYFPAELVGVYQTAQKIANLHLASTKTPCRSMPRDVKEQFRSLFASKSTVGGGKHYWAEAGRTIGLVDSSDGIRFNG